MKLTWEKVFILICSICFLVVQLMHQWCFILLVTHTQAKSSLHHYSIVLGGYCLLNICPSDMQRWFCPHVVRISFPVDAISALFLFYPFPPPSLNKALKQTTSHCHCYNIHSLIHQNQNNYKITSNLQNKIQLEKPNVSLMYGLVFILTQTLNIPSPFALFTGHVFGVGVTLIQCVFIKADVFNSLPWIVFSFCHFCRICKLYLWWSLTFPWRQRKVIFLFLDHHKNWQMTLINLDISHMPFYGLQP